MFGFTLTEQEKLVRVHRQSKLILLPRILLVLVAVLVPWLYFIHIDLEGYSAYLVIWFLIILLFFLRPYAEWRINRYILTSSRLVCIRHIEVFKREVNETPLDRILNVSFRTTGLMSILLNFGDVEVHVIGLHKPIVLKSVRRPEELKNYLWEIHEHVLRMKGDSNFIHTHGKLNQAKGESDD
jgi:membrane protein YdbS with pleckstrin-like domain